MDFAIFELDKSPLILKVQKIKIAEFANSTDPDETPHHEPTYLDLHNLCSSL